MTTILTSLHGKQLGIDVDGFLTSPVGIKVPQVYVGASGSEVALGGSDAVATPSTADTLSAGGLSILSSTAVKAYVMAAPVPGVVKRLFATAVTTAARTVTLASGQFQSTAQSTLATLTFDGAGQSLTLVGLSTAKYGVTANMGVTLA